MTTATTTWIHSAEAFGLPVTGMLCLGVTGGRRPSYTLADNIQAEAGR